MTRLFCLGSAGLGLLLLAAPAAVADELFDHNGSVMAVDYASGTIAYQVVKPSISKTIAPGAIVFSGSIQKGNLPRARPTPSDAAARRPPMPFPAVTMPRCPASC